MGICQSICFFKQKKPTRNTSIQYSQLGDPLVENEAEEKQHNEDQLKMIICQNIPEDTEQKLFYTYEDSLGFSVSYQYDLINKYRIFLEIDGKTYVGNATSSWQDAISNLLSEQNNPSISNNIDRVMNPYK